VPTERPRQRSWGLLLCRASAVALTRRRSCGTGRRWSRLADASPGFGLAVGVVASTRNTSESDGSTETPRVWRGQGSWDCLAHLVPDLVPVYMVTVGTRWYLLGRTAAQPYQLVPTSTNEHKHYYDSNSLGGTIKPQVRGLFWSISGAKSVTKACPSEGHIVDKTAAQRPFRPQIVAQKSLLLRTGPRHRLVARFVARSHPDALWVWTWSIPLGAPKGRQSRSSNGVF